MRGLPRPQAEIAILRRAEGKDHASEKQACKKQEAMFGSVWHIVHVIVFIIFYHRFARAREFISHTLSMPCCAMCPLRLRRTL